MRTRCSCRVAVSVLAVIVANLSAAARGGELTVVSVEPASHLNVAPVDTAIVAHFDRPVRRESVTGGSFWVFGRWSGRADAVASFSNNDQTVTLTPARAFSAGETVTVFISHDLAAADGSPIREGGYSWQFWTAAGPGRHVFRQADNMTTRTTPGQSTRSYGGIGADLDGDGWLDITVVNEDTADLRVFMNRADGSGLYEPFIQPTFPVNDRASPSDSADFNGDGHSDMCVVNINTDSVSIMLGNGDGTFAPQQEIIVGDTPRGVAVLDVDGDGDMDVVNTNFWDSRLGGRGNLSILFNDGNGVFSAPTFFKGDCEQCWALASTDMDNDGMLDLVSSSRVPGNGAIVVNRGMGDGTFTMLSRRTNVSDGTWMLTCGDVNGDGWPDVATSDSSSNRGAILLNDGAGGLGTVQNYQTDPFPLATDLGDLDGDGDLDWVISSFQGDWRIFENDGAGGFTLLQEVNAPQAASCATLLDMDNDGDLDLALIDEIADRLIIVHNQTVGDMNCDGAIDAFDIEPFTLALLNPGQYASQYPNCAVILADIDGDGAVNAFDIEPFVGLLLAP